MGSRSEECPSGAEGAPSEKGSQPLLGSLTRRCSGTLSGLFTDLGRDVEK